MWQMGLGTDAERWGRGRPGMARQIRYLSGGREREGPGWRGPTTGKWRTQEMDNSKEPKAGSILDRLPMRTIKITVVGTTPLVVQKWEKKSIMES